MNEKWMRRRMVNDDEGRNQDGDEGATLEDGTARQLVLLLVTTRCQALQG